MLGFGSGSAARAAERRSAEAFKEARKLLRANDVERALPLLEESVAANPANGAAAARLARLLESLNREDEAEAVLRRALRHGDDPVLAGTLVRFVERRGRFTALQALLDEYRARAVAEPRLARDLGFVLTQHARFDEARSLLEAALRATPDDVDLVVSRVDTLLAAGDLAAARAALRAAGAGTDARLLTLEAEILTAENHAAEAGAVLERARAAIAALPLSEGRAERVTQRMERAAAYLRMLGVTERLYRDGAQPAEPCGVVVLVTNGSSQVTFMTALSALQLRQRGHAVVHLCAEGMVDTGRVGIEGIDALHGLLAWGNKRLRDEADAPGGLRHEWQVDWPARVVRAGGLDLYQPVYETLCQRFRRYTIDLAEPVYGAWFTELQRQADAMLAVCERIEREPALQGLPIRFLGAMPHFIPNAVLRIWCEQRGWQRDAHYVNFVAAYEHYYSNATNTSIGAVSVEDLTRFRDRQRMPLHARAEQLDAWRAGLADEEAVVREALAIVNLNRVRARELAPEAVGVLERARAHRAAGGAVACLFGKVLYDMCVPREGGPGHRDMRDWLNHSIDAVRGSDTLLVIKPHPNELNKTFSQPTERFRDLIDVELPDNVLLLEPRWLNIRELLPHVDLGVIWSGSTAVELGAAGVPVLICSEWGARDWPVDFRLPRDREDHARLLRAPREVGTSEALARRCALLIKYLSTEELMIPFPYARMPLRHLGEGLKEWDEEALARYLREGDPNVDRMTARCL